MSNDSSRVAMPIPKSRAEAFAISVVTVVIVFVSLLAVVNICKGVALIASIFWLMLVALAVRGLWRRAGGLRKAAVNLLGDMAGERFVESAPAAGTDQPAELRFGFQFGGHRFIQRKLRLADIETIEWNPGQASARSGRDMNDWHVAIWFDHHDPAELEKRTQRKYRKPEQDVMCIGPADRKAATETLGHAFIDFARTAGAHLIQGDSATCFVRRR